MISILQELHIPLTPDQEHKRDFQDIHVAGFRNGKSLKYQLVRTKLPNAEETGRSGPCGNRNFQVCNFVWATNTFSSKACDEIFRIKNDPINCNSQKIVYPLKHKT